MLPHVLMPVLGRDKGLSSHFLVANLIGGDSPDDSEREEPHSEQEDKDWQGEYPAIALIVHPMIYQLQCINISLFCFFMY